VGSVENKVGGRGGSIWWNEICRTNFDNRDFSNGYSVKTVYKSILSGESSSNNPL
jgi:hypothetical protein